MSKKRPNYRNFGTRLFDDDPPDLILNIIDRVINTKFNSFFPFLKTIRQTDFRQKHIFGRLVYIALIEDRKMPQG